MPAADVPLDRVAHSESIWHHHDASALITIVRRECYAGWPTAEHLPVQGSIGALSEMIDPDLRGSPSDHGDSLGEMVECAALLRY